MSQIYLFTSTLSPKFNDVHLVADVWNNSFDGCDNEHERERSLVMDDGRAVKDDDVIKFEIEEDRRIGIFGVVDLFSSLINETIESFRLFTTYSYLYL